MTPDDFAAILDTWPPTNRTNAHTVLGAMPPPDDLVRAAVNLAPLLLDLWLAALDAAAYWPEPGQSMTTGEHEQVVAVGRLRETLAALEAAE